MGTRLVATGFGGSQRPQELRGVSGISVLPRFILATSGSGMDCSESQDTSSVQCQDTSRSPGAHPVEMSSVPPGIHQCVLVSNLLGVSGDGVG